MFNLDLDQDFQARWQGTPHLVRQIYMQDFSRIEQLLDGSTPLVQWKENEPHAKAQSSLLVEQTYHDLKDVLIQRQKQLQQLVLEQKLNRKRADDLAQQFKVQQVEQQKALEQTQRLQHLAQDLQQESQQYADRFQATPTPIYGEHLTELDSLKLRLELESEATIQQQIQQLRQQLQAAAKEEIALILEQHQASAQ
ncbi:MAG: hypothetical protein Q4D05_04695 [Acinetobacter sp.]|nr:hypothetical protein [Acinetobacter sp.]